MAGASLAAFGIGAIGTITGTLVAWRVLGTQMGPDGSKVHAHPACNFLTALGCWCLCTVLTNREGRALAWQLPSVDGVVSGSYRQACGEVSAFDAWRGLANIDQGCWRQRAFSIVAPQSMSA